MTTTTITKSPQLCPTLCSPIDGSPQAPWSLGFSRQEHWSGVPFANLFPLAAPGYWGAALDCGTGASHCGGISVEQGLRGVPLQWLLGARVRYSAHGKGHEEGGSTYTKARSSLRSPPGNPLASIPITRACLLYYVVLSPTPLTLRGAVPHHLFWRRN